MKKHTRAPRLQIRPVDVERDPDLDFLRACLSEIFDAPARPEGCTVAPEAWAWIDERNFDDPLLLNPLPESGVPSWMRG